MRRAGLKAWPRLWHNLRASRETELAESFPAHVVCEWIGNSQRVAAEHYLQVTDEHFRRAAAVPAPAVQKAVQYAAVGSRTMSHADGEAIPMNDANPIGDEGLLRAAAQDENDSEPQGGPEWTRTIDLLHVKQFARPAEFPADRRTISKIQGE